ncbi:MAG: hypothetical protein KTR31_17985 [Myxococcales bacterium]|nr:hypothetical protein [Myxococcales bacterium]
MFRIVVAGFVAAVLGSACDEDDGVSFKGANEGPPAGSPGDDTGAILQGQDGSCDRIVLDGTCRQYPGYGWTDTAVAEDCNNGVRTSGDCPLGDRVGSCDEDPTGAFATLRVFYVGVYYDDKEAPDLQTSCELNGGTWITGVPPQ